MQPTATRYRRRQQNSRFCQVRWLLLKQGDSTATTNKEKQTTTPNQILICRYIGEGGHLRATSGTNTTPVLIAKNPTNQQTPTSTNHKTDAESKRL